ncbi:alpha/beta hydrolase [Mycobacterium sp. Lab-001]|uniref:alpha/beta hydrolase n=1 Tax=Mycobacterium sp. Lab-001 TaxID=3410136 RepID=UPI003D1873CB
MLEVLDIGTETATHETPLLFVHGTSHAAWCWDEHFLRYFSEHGYRAAAVNLRGHGRSRTDTPIRRVSLADFVEDLRASVVAMGTAPVLIGHSLGGFVIARYLERYETPGAILVASAPPYGSWGTLSRALRRYPRLMLKTALRGKLGLDFSAPALARRWFFSRDLPEELVVRYAACLQEESDRALIDCLFQRRVRGRRSVPMLVLAAQDDFVFSPRDTAATARAYGAEWQLIPHLAHDVMLDTRWQAAAEAIRLWLDQHGF